MRKAGLKCYLTLILVAAAFLLLMPLVSLAEEVTILYTGDTHAMLYPCDCPQQPSGGLARRSTLVRQIRKRAPEALLLDAGSFFAGGPLDEYTQNSQLDQERTLANIRAMELMNYTAACIGDAEFNFGEEFFKEIAANNEFPLLSCNIRLNKVHPFIIKQVGSLRIGIVGVSTPRVASKAAGVSPSAPREALKDAIKELKDNQVEVIILLSRLDHGQDLELIKEIPGIDVLITRYTQMSEGAAESQDSTIILRPAKQARSLGKLTLEIDQGLIKGYKDEKIELTKKYKDDSGILSILPECFRDNDCKKEANIGSCNNPGSESAECKFNPASKVKLWVIEPKRDELFDTEQTVTYFEGVFPGVSTSRLTYPQRKARDLVAELGIQTLPAFVFEEVIGEEAKFKNLRGKFEERGGFYLLKPEFSGVAYYINREKLKGIDLFISLYAKNSSGILEAVRSFTPEVHFLATQKNGKFQTATGSIETEEYLRGLCVKEYYPQNFWDYIICRAKNIGSSWWEECLGSEYDTSLIRDCAKSQEGRDLLKRNIQLNDELQVMFGPTFLMDNQQIFSISGAGSKEEFKRIFRR